MIIRKDIYKQFCGDLRKQHIKEIHNFLEENILTKALSHEAKTLLCNKSCKGSEIVSCVIICGARS